MAICRVMAVFQGASLLPEDQFVNTFHFAEFGTTQSGEYEQDCADAVGAFYVDVVSGETMGSFLSPYVKRVFVTKSYNLSIPEGTRVPTITGWTLPAGATEGMPEEVAICCTLEGAPPVTPRRRGRIYIGPLTNYTFTRESATTTLPCRPNFSTSSSVGQQLINRCAILASKHALGWSIRSVTPTENFVKIVGGYVDNAFDTQRRRGPDPTARTTFDSLVLPP